MLLQQLHSGGCLHSRRDRHLHVQQLPRHSQLRCSTASSPSLPLQGDQRYSAMAGEGDVSAEQWDGELHLTGKTTSRKAPPTYAKPSIVSTGTLMPSAEWYPAWMRYRTRESNHVFWTDKFNRNSLDILPAEKRWTVFSTFWYLAMQFRFYAVPPAFRFFIAMGWRHLMFAAYGAHKALVLWQCKVDAALATQAVERRRSAVAASSPSSSSSSGASSSTGSQASSSSSNSSREPSSSGRQGGDRSSSSGSSTSQVVQGEGSPHLPGFSKAMALRRLHWQNSLLGEIMYMVNVYKTGRVHLLPPRKRPAERPTLFWLF